jgi:hypothetical protein
MRGDASRRHKRLTIERDCSTLLSCIFRELERITEPWERFSSRDRHRRGFGAPVRRRRLTPLLHPVRPISPSR